MGIPLEMIRRLAMVKMSPDCWRILMVVISQTVAVNKTSTELKNKDFVLATGMNKGHVGRALQRLLDTKVVVSDTGRFGETRYKINKKYQRWINTPQMSFLNGVGSSNASAISSRAEPVRREKADSNGYPNSHQSDLKIADQLFEEIWKRYPKKLGKSHAYRHFKRTVTDPDAWDKINTALDNYIRAMAGKHPQFIMHGSTWFNQWQDWVTYKEPTRDIRDGMRGW